MRPKRSTIRFAELRDFLLDLGFRQVKLQGGGYRFEHALTDTILLYRSYKAREFTYAIELVKTSFLLDQRGIVAREAFEDSLRKTPA